VAGGFGIGIPNPGVTPDLASVVPYHEGRLSIQSSKDDLEATGDGKKRQSGTVELEPVVPLDTPFFHLDLAAAVRAAEKRGDALTPLI
jgi:sodium-independent sulfate anion transporter 11